jgi:hypothetical protein
MTPLLRCDICSPRSISCCSLNWKREGVTTSVEVEHYGGVLVTVTCYNCSVGIAIWSTLPTMHSTERLLVGTTHAHELDLYFVWCQLTYICILSGISWIKDILYMVSQKYNSFSPHVTEYVGIIQTMDWLYVKPYRIWFLHWTIQIQCLKKSLARKGGNYKSVQTTVTLQNRDFS